MAPGMDEDRLLAEIERSLVREDPALDERMSALGRQFTDEPPDRAASSARGARSGDASDGDGRSGREGRRRDWRKIVAVVAIVVAVLGMILTAVLMRPAEPVGDQVPAPISLPAATAVLQITTHTL